jgi:hypothetical protein
MSWSKLKGGEKGEEKRTTIGLDDYDLSDGEFSEEPVDYDEFVLAFGEKEEIPNQGISTPLYPIGATDIIDIDNADYDSGATTTTTVITDSSTETDAGNAIEINEEKPSKRREDLGIAVLQDGATVEKYVAAKKSLLEFRKKLAEIGQNKLFKDKVSTIMDGLGELYSPPRKADQSGAVDTKAVQAFNKHLDLVADVIGAAKETDAQAAEAGPAKPWKALRDGEIVSFVEKSGMLQDRNLQQKLAARGGTFGWTNVKGAVNEFFGGNLVKAAAKEKTSTQGGERKTFNLEIRDSNIPDEKKRSVKEIDNVILVKNKQKWIVETVFEVKSSASDATKAKAQAKDKVKALQSARKNPHYLIYQKEGDELTDITKTLVIGDDIESSTVGPGKGFDQQIEDEYTAEQVADQLAISWLLEDEKRTIDLVALGTGAGMSKLCEFVTSKEKSEGKPTEKKEKEKVQEGSEDMK